MQQVFSALNNFIMGNRPYNTVFSFNYHNINHIVRFLNEAKKNLPAGKLSFIDIGGGAAPYYILFKEMIKDYTVVDVENVLPKEDDRNITFIKSFAEELPIADNSFDVVLSNQVFEHVQSPEKSAAESFRILKKGGFILGSVPHVSPIHLEPYDYRRFTEYGLRKTLEEAGFTNVKIDGSGGVFKAAALMTLMDLTLSKRVEGKPQRFLTKKHFLLSPLNGFVNVSAIILDFIFGDKKRSPSNYCWTAQKK
ncbi:MAG: class I SAM-dependent methyltransferase [Chitinophagales bacterium]|nr:class I SAM-dependent methyltransferase [Chitinophagales bacterium]